MSDIVPTTGEPVAPGTGGDNPTAIPDANTTNPPATDDKTVTLSQADYKNLVAQRDRANNDASYQADFVNTLAKERDIDLFLESNKEKYSYVKRADLMHASDPEELERIAADRQRAYEDVIQENLAKVQVADTPVLSPEEKQAQLQKLKDSPSSDSFQEMLRLQQQ